MLHRRLARDYETLPVRSKAMTHMAMTDLLARRLTGERTPRENNLSARAPPGGVRISRAVGRLPEPFLREGCQGKVHGLLVTLQNYFRFKTTTRTTGEEKPCPTMGATSPSNTGRSSWPRSPSAG